MTRREHTDRLGITARRSLTANRESGIWLIAVLAFMAYLSAISAAVAMMGTVSLQTSQRSSEWMRAYYVADSGAQIGNALVRASSGTLDAVVFTESLPGGDADVDINPVGGGVYNVSSAGTVGDTTVNVEILVEFIPTSLLDAAFQVNVSNGVEVDGDEVPIRLSGTVDFSGMDHDLSGTQLADQTKAVHAVALNPVPGDTGLQVDIDVAATPFVTLEGSPDATTNDADNISNVVETLSTYAQSSADVTVVGTTTLSTSDTGAYGTAADPVFTYVNLGDNESLTINGSFEGYGTLFVDVGAVTNLQVFTLDGSAKWTGLVVFRFRDDVTLTNRDLINVVGTNGIVGGLLTAFSGSSLDFGGSGNLLRVTGTATILYSSSTISSYTPGVEQVVDQTPNLASYNVQ